MDEPLTCEQYFGYLTRGKISVGCRSENSGLPYGEPTHYQLSYAVPFELRYTFEQRSMNYAAPKDHHPYRSTCGGGAERVSGGRQRQVDEPFHRLIISILERLVLLPPPVCILQKSGSPFLISLIWLAVVSSQTRSLSVERLLL